MRVTDHDSIEQIDRDAALLAQIYASYKEKCFLFTWRYKREATRGIKLPFSSGDASCYDVL